MGKRRDKRPAVDRYPLDLSLVRCADDLVSFRGQHPNSRYWKLWKGGDIDELAFRSGVSGDAMLLLFYIGNQVVFQNIAVVSVERAAEVMGSSISKVKRALYLVPYQFSPKSRRTIIS